MVSISYDITWYDIMKSASKSKSSPYVGACCQKPSLLSVFYVLSDLPDRDEAAWKGVNIPKQKKTEN